MYMYYGDDCDMLLHRLSDQCHQTTMNIRLEHMTAYYTEWATVSYSELVF